MYCRSIQVGDLRETAGKWLPRKNLGVTLVRLNPSKGFIEGHSLQSLNFLGQRFKMEAHEIREG